MIVLLGELVGCAVVKTQASFSWNKKQRDSTEKTEEWEVIALSRLVKTGLKVSDTWVLYSPWCYLCGWESSLERTKGHGEWVLTYEKLWESADLSFGPGSVTSFLSDNPHISKMKGLNFVNLKVSNSMNSLWLLFMVFVEDPFSEEAHRNQRTHNLFLRDWTIWDQYRVSFIHRQRRSQVERFNG